MESFQDITAELDRMLAAGASAAELAEAVGKLHRLGQSPLAAQRGNCAKLLDVETARKWPEEHAEAFAAFVMNMPCIPLPASYPCGQKELFIAEALGDSGVSKELRIHFWRTLVMEGYKFPCYTGREWKEIPLALYDIPNVRAWICQTKQPGWEDVRCSDPVFFGTDPRNSFTKEPEKKALEAIAKDSPSALLMPLSIEGRELPAKYAQAAMASRAIKTATYLYSNDKKFSRLFTARQLLFYVCANWNDDDTIPFVAMLEKDNPGLVKNTLDAFGHDALWYTLYQRDRFNRATLAARRALDPLDRALIEFGCDPERPNSVGLSYNDLTVSEG